MAEAFSEGTGNDAVFRDVSQEEWFEGMRTYVDPEARMPIGAAEDAETATTFHKSFDAWWNLWKFNVRDKEAEAKQRDFMAELNPARPKNFAAWMNQTRYSGVSEEPLKVRKDEDGDKSC